MPTLHHAPPFRAEQMGSLLRPENLLKIREKIANTGITEEEAGLPAVEKEAVHNVVQMQRELGFRAVTSGEYNRTRFWGLMWDEFEGKTHFERTKPPILRTKKLIRVSNQAQSVSKMPKHPCSGSTIQT